MAGMLMFSNNLEELAEAIGNYMGMADGIETPAYMDTILTRAYRTADRKFNTAAAVAAKPKHFTHMYEHNTAGVTAGDGTLDPKRQASRLWRTELLGSGGHKVITYVFRPALRPNPPKKSGDPEVGDIDQKVLNLLKVNQNTKYVWRNRAEATEKNERIFIKAQEDGFLFIPVVQDLHNPKPYEEARGYGIRKQHISNPGEWTRGYGQFTGFFLSWWETAGSKSVGDSLINYVNNDVRKFAKSIGLKRGVVKPANMVMIFPASAAGRKKTTQQWRLKAVGQDLEGFGAEKAKVL